MLFLRSCTLPLLLATAISTTAFYDPIEKVHRVSLMNQRTPFTTSEAALGIIARQLNGTGVGGGSCSGLQEACSAADGGGCCPLMEACCGTGCCPKYYTCAIDEHLEKPCKCYGSLCDEYDDDDDSSSGSGSGSGSGSSGDDDLDDSDGSGGSSGGNYYSGDDSDDDSGSSSGGDNAGDRLSSIGVGVTVLIAGIVVAVL